MKRERKDYGAPLRIYDLGARYAYRYTLLPPRSQATMQKFSRIWDGGVRHWAAATASGAPIRDQTLGFCLEVIVCSQLGKRITWAELPADVQKFARQSFLREYCP